MSFSRTTLALVEGPALHAAMRGIGMRVGSPKGRATAADLEVTLVSVANDALPDDYRVLGVIVAWLEVHHARVNVPRLGRLVREGSELLLAMAWWASIGLWLAREDPRWGALARLYAGKRLDLDDSDVTELQLRKVGSDPRFAGSPLRVHAKLLRPRRADVDDEVELGTRHPLYLRRVQFGPSYRADVWAALDQDPDATAAEIARRVGCAYETARSVARDWRTVRATRLVRDRLRGRAAFARMHE